MPIKFKNQLIALIVVVIATTASCRKIIENNLVKGLWEIESIAIDTTTLNNRNTPYVRALINKANANNGNYLHAFLEGYTENQNKAYYRIKYERDGIVFTYYNIGDSNVYTTIGKWELIKADEIHQKVDRFWEGVFDLKKDGTTNYIYKSGMNYIKFLNDTVSITVKTKKVK